VTLPDDDRPAGRDRLACWNERYSRGEELHGYAPSPPLPAAIAGVAPGLALDLACGAGRHALYLAAHGWRVVAVDGSSVAIELLRARARELRLGHRIEAHVAELESQPCALAAPPAAYDLVADFYFLHRPLLAGALGTVRAGGLFAAAIHVAPPEGEAGHRFTLEPGELERLVRAAGFDVLQAREGESPESGHAMGTAEIVARRRGPA
jgi:SAM-dependent methyltransferase